MGDELQASGGCGEQKGSRLAVVGGGALNRHLLHTILIYGHCLPLSAPSFSNTPSPPRSEGFTPRLPQFPQLPVVADSNSIVLLRTEANGVINYLLSAGLSSECDQYLRLSFRAALQCSPSPTPTAREEKVWAATLALPSDPEQGVCSLGPGMELLSRLEEEQG